MRVAHFAHLGEVCDSISYGVTASAVFDKIEGPQLLRITDLTESGVNWESVPKCLINDEDERSSLLQSGDIVVARTGGTVGKSYLIIDPPRAVNASYLLRLRPDQTHIVPGYLHQFMGSECYWKQLYDAVRGAAQPNVNATMLATITVPLPDIAEQRRIATRLADQLTEFERARRAAATQLFDIFRLTDAIIVQSVETGKAKSATIGNVLDELKEGIGKHWKEYPVLGATRDGVAPAKEPPGKHAVRYKPAFPGTVFYNPMRIMIGSIAFVDDDDKPGITSPDYVVLRGRDGMVDSRWFYYWLRSPLGAQCINALARGAVRERMLFNRLAEGTMDLPGFSAQQKASLALRGLTPLRTAIQKNVDEINLLSRKILAQAF